MACFAKIFVTFLDFRKDIPVDKKVRNQKRPEFSKFLDLHFRENFAKLFTERSTLDFIIHKAKH